MAYDALVVAAHPDDAETQMGGTLAKLAAKGQHILLVDLSDGGRAPRDRWECGGAGAIGWIAG